MRSSHYLNQIVLKLCAVLASIYKQEKDPTEDMTATKKEPPTALNLLSQIPLDSLP